MTIEYFAQSSEYIIKDLHDLYISYISAKIRNKDMTLLL